MSDPATQELLEIIEGGSDEASRRQAIQQLAASPSPDAGRVLMQTYQHCYWRGTKILVLKSLGQIPQQRVVEFLMQLAKTEEDAGLASAAIHALGTSGTPEAGAYLCHLLANPDAPLVREAVMALGHMVRFPCGDDLLQFIENPQVRQSPGLLQYGVLAIAKQGGSHFWPQLSPLLHQEMEGEIQESRGQVLNALLLAAAHLGDQQTFLELEGLDTRQHFFPQQLKHTAMTWIHHRQNKSVEDAVSQLLDADTPAKEEAALIGLRGFPPTEVAEALSILGGEATTSQQLLGRLAICATDAALPDDLEFVAKNWQQLHPHQWANLLRPKAQKAPENCYEELVKLLTAPQLHSLLQHLSLPHSCVDLCRQVDQQTEGQDPETGISAINGLVAQLQMQVPGTQNKLHGQLGKALLHTAQSHKIPEVQGRAIRALGQIAYDAPEVITAFAKGLKSSPKLLTSYVYALARLPSGTNLLTKKLKQLIGNDDAEPQIALILTALFNHPQLEPNALDNLLEKDFASWRLPLLAILTRVHHPAATEFLKQQLGSPHFFTQMSAVVATKKNRDPSLSQTLLQLLNASNPCLQERALDTLCTSSDPATQRHLWPLLAPEADSRQQLLKVLRSLVMDGSHQVYRDLLGQLETYLDGCPGHYSAPEVKEAALNLRDNLKLALESPAAKSSSAKLHDLDGELNNEIRGYAAFSTAVKSVLRNGELAFRYPDLFDEGVDKSTVIVEYVKSIDIRLQESLGASIFLSSQPALFHRMQSRVVAMELDGDFSAAQIVKDLQCHQQFSPQDFPAHKLSQICRQISTGKILHDQYRSLDGLRAWAMILLVFARSFKFRGHEVAPLLPVKNSQNTLITGLAAHMNKLQHLRNQAAHRGTILQTGQLGDVRQLCFEVLGGLREVVD